MTSRHSPGSDNSDQEDGPAAADIAITAQGDRRRLEALYLELRELAQQTGLEIEYRLTLTPPGEERKR